MLGRRFEGKLPKFSGKHEVIIVWQFGDNL